MSYIYIPYQSVDELIYIFQNTNVTNFAINPTQKNPIPNFVLINPQMYYGSYGGILYTNIVQGLDDCISESLGNDLSLVWWNSFPRFVGDICALSFQNRVTVTPSMFKKMNINTIRKPKFEKSSYFANKAWRINSESTLY